MCQSVFSIEKLTILQMTQRMNFFIHCYFGTDFCAVKKIVCTCMICVHVLFFHSLSLSLSLFSNEFRRAANWNLSEPLWTGRMKLVAKGINVNLKLEDKNTGALYANCPVETYPGKRCANTSFFTNFRLDTLNLPSWPFALIQLN